MSIKTFILTTLVIYGSMVVYQKWTGPLLATHVIPLLSPFFRRSAALEPVPDTGGILVGG